MLRGNLCFTALVASLSLPAAALAQSAPSTADVNVYSPRDLAAKTADLRKQALASPNGSASITLDHWPQHYSMLAYRVKSGGAELHAKFADVFVIERGSATLVSGGTIISRVEKSGGEAGGTGIEGGTPHPLHAGDIVHIPAGLPHQMQVAPGKTVLYFVVKVEQDSAH